MPFETKQMNPEFSMAIIPSISAKMRKVFNESAEQAAVEQKLVQRKGGKVTGTNLSEMLVFGWWQNPEATLSELVQTGAAVGLEITEQGLDQRWDERTAKFLRCLLEHVVSEQVEGEEVNEPLLGRFSAVYLEDSSIVTLPNEFAQLWQGCGGSASSSAVKAQTRLEMRYGRLDGPHLVKGRMHDRRASANHAVVEEKALRITDLGYWKLSEQATAHEQGSYWLTRLKSRVQFWVDDASWTIADWCLQATGDSFTVDVLLGKAQKLPARLHGRRVPPNVAAERRRKEKRKAQKKQQTVSAARLALCDWTILVTNAPQSLLNAEEAFVLYRFRWQIELLFKLWKSHGQLDKSRSENPWRRLCEFYAKLIAMVLQQWLFCGTIWRFFNRSWVKAAAILRVHVIRILTTLSDDLQLQAVLSSIRTILSTGCKINPSQKQPRSFQLFHHLEGCNP